MPVQRAPDWEIKPTGPRNGVLDANDALMGVKVLIMPKQLGPSRPMSFFLHTLTNSRSKRAPSIPISLKPADITMAFFNFFSAHSLII